MNVSFLLKHCRYLVLSIDSTESLGRAVARRVIGTFDTALAGLGNQYHELRPRVLSILKSQRNRPSWHDLFLLLEHACWPVFANDIHSSGASIREANAREVLEEAYAAAYILRDGMETLFVQPRHSRGKLHQLVKSTVGTLTSLLAQSGPYEEHSEYLHYGILDLLYQLSFRLRKSSRSQCFLDYAAIIRMVLERSSIVILHSKASDLWNRIVLFGNQDDQLYGDKSDREAIACWLMVHVGNTVVQFEGHSTS